MAIKIMIPALTAKGFILRPFRKGDEESLQRSINNRKIYRHTLRIPYPYTLKHARDWVKKCILQSRKKRLGEINFGIDINGELVGGVGLTNVEQHKAEIGYWLAEQHWGKGVMTGAVRLVCSFGFRRLKLRRIYAHVFVKNRASARVLEKAGFSLEGLMRKLHKKDGKFVDALTYAKVK